MKILSLFDGIACWYEALQRAWIKIDKYYASEIDKYAIQIATKNHPDIIEIWDVKSVRGGEYLGIDLLIWGSPCQWFSVAGKQLNFEDPRSKLFFEYVRILKESNPKYFLLENVSKRREWIEIINRELWVEWVEINSNILSAQSRRRIYRTNIPNISLPENSLYTLKDILLNEVEDKYRLNEQQVEKMRYLKWYKAIPRIKNWYEYIYREWAMSFPDRLDRPSRTILTSEGTISRTTHVIGDNKWYRKLTPIECERLQTLPDNYTEWVSDSQRYKMLGNGRTVDVIKHIFSFIPKTDED